MINRCKSCPNAAAFSFFHQSNSYTALMSNADPALRSLDIDEAMSTLVQLPMDDKVLTTFNDHALTSGRGLTLKWDRYDIDGHPGAQSMHLELARNDIGSVALLPAAQEFRGLDVLLVFGLTGNLIHRVVFGASTALELDYVKQVEPPTLKEPAPHSHQDKPIDLRATRALIDGWDCHGARWHLEQIQKDQGRARLRTLPLIASERAKRICVDALYPWLCAAHREGLPYARILPQGKWLQCDSSEISKVTIEGGFIAIVSTLGATLFDVTNITQCWRTEFLDRGTPVSLLELYSQCGECIAVLAPFRDYLLAPWLDQTASLFQD